MIKTIRSFVAIGAVCAALAFAPASQAASVLNISSLQNVGTITADSVNIVFAPVFPTANFNVGGGNSGFFLPATGTGQIAPFANSTSASATPFLTLNDGAFGLFVLNLTSAFAASGSTLGPIITLQQIGPNVNATIGLVVSGTDNSGNPIAGTGILSAQLTTTTVDFVSAHGIGQTSWAGTFTVDGRQDVPEPLTFATIGAGLLALGVAGRKRALNN